MLSFAAAGVPPEIMGIGPAYAIPKALEKTGLGVKDIDIWEVNEAFASQATMSIEALKIPKDKLNPRGGAIALGHPLGMTGARMICTLFPRFLRWQRPWSTWQSRTLSPWRQPKSIKKAVRILRMMWCRNPTRCFPAVCAFQD